MVKYFKSNNIRSSTPILPQCTNPHGFRPQTATGPCVHPACSMCAPTKRRGNERAVISTCRAWRDEEKSVGDVFVFYFGSGASASNGENLVMGRGVERLIKLKKLCAVLDMNGNA